MKVRVNCPAKGCGGILCNLTSSAGEVVVRPGAGVTAEWHGDVVTLRCRKRTRRGRCVGNVRWGRELQEAAYQAGCLVGKIAGRPVAVPAEMVRVP